MKYRALFVLFVIATILFSFWAYAVAPCSFYKYMPAREIPGRCLMP